MIFLRSTATGALLSNSYIATLGLLLNKNRMSFATTMNFHFMEKNLHVSETIN